MIGFALAFVALALLPFFGTDFGKGAVRWYSLRFRLACSRREFLKPGFVVVAAWLMAAGQEVNGPPGKLWSFVAHRRHRGCSWRCSPISARPAWCCSAGA